MKGLFVALMLAPLAAGCSTPVDAIGGAHAFGGYFRDDASEAEIDAAREHVAEAGAELRTRRGEGHLRFIIEAPKFSLCESLWEWARDEPAFEAVGSCDPTSVGLPF